MAEGNGNGFEGHVGSFWLKVTGQQAPLIIIVVIVVLLVGSVLWAGQQRQEKQHEVMSDAFDAYVWTQMPAQYRDRMTPPKWVRERLNVEEKRVR